MDRYMTDHDVWPTSPEILASKLNFWDDVLGSSFTEEDAWCLHPFRNVTEGGFVEYGYGFVNEGETSMIADKSS